MKTRIALFALGLAAVISLAVVMLGNRPTTQEVTRADTGRVATPEPANEPVAPAVTPAPSIFPSPAVQTSENSPPSQSANAAAPKSNSTKKPKEPLHDPDARAAMSLVGIDPDAEAYWLEAIFDSSLPDGEREDLMEDLNEEGLSDTKRPGPQDFPLIMNRLAIIAEIAPHADQFMLPHLAEAYKDLWNLAEITQGGGRPVR